MIHPTDAAIAAIRAFVADWTQPDEAILAALNAPTLANPEPAPTVAPPLFESELLALLTDPANGSLAKLLNWVNFGLLKQDIRDQNAAGVALWCQVLPALGLITPDEAAAIAAKATTTIPDPTWPAMVSWAQLNLGRPAGPLDIVLARPEG